MEYHSTRRGDDATIVEVPSVPDNSRLTDGSKESPDDSEWAVISRRDDLSDYNIDNLLPQPAPIISKIRRWLQPTAYDGKGSEYRKHHPYVAVKRLIPTGLQKADFETFIKAEYETLDMLREADSRHLIKAIAFYRSAKGDAINFVLSYAQHGNLRTFWEQRIPSIDDANYMTWGFSQLEGLALAIWEMHEAWPGQYCRHGDLKPENILCFDSNSATSVKDQTSCVLVIADMGISRTHNKSTEFRTTTKMAKADTVAYAAPETDLFPNNPTSCRADMWALECLYLEFLIWLLHGNDGLKRFSNDVGKDKSSTRPAKAQQQPSRLSKSPKSTQRWRSGLTTSRQTLAVPEPVRSRLRLVACWHSLKGRCSTQKQILTPRIRCLRPATCLKRTRPMTAWQRPNLKSFQAFRRSYFRDPRFGIGRCAT